MVIDQLKLDDIIEQSNQHSIFENVDSGCRSMSPMVQPRNFNILKNKTKFLKRPKPRRNKTKLNKTIDIHGSYDFMVLSKKLSPKFLKHLRNSSPPMEKKHKLVEFVSFGHPEKVKKKDTEILDKKEEKAAAALENTAFKE